MMDADDLLDAVADAVARQARPTRIGTVHADHTTGDPRVQWDGEDAATATTYPRISCSVAAGDRVVAVQAGSTWAIVGRIGGPRFDNAAEELLTDWRNGWGSHGTDAHFPRARRHHGVVTVSGLIAGGTLGATALILPAAFRPKRAMYLQTPSDGGGAGRVQFLSDGVVHVVGHPTNAWVSIAATFIWAGAPDTPG